MKLLTKSLLALALTSSFTACIKNDDAPAGLQKAIPTADQVKINLPQSASRSVGQLADWYVATRNVTATFNGGSAWVLVLVHTIVQFPVTTVDGDVYTWGPWHDGALAPAEYRLDVTDNEDGTYNYQLLGRSRTETNAQFEVVIDGFADPRPGELQGNGSFKLDFDAGKRVNPIDADPTARGSILAKYDLAAKHLELGIDSTNDAGEPVAADYTYNEAASGAGDMVFDVDGDAGGGAAKEHITLRSRWNSDGNGRADARVTDGDITAAIDAQNLQASLPDGVHASECWDGMFKRTFYTNNLAQYDAAFPQPEGDVSACAFATEDLPPAN
ncbi:MAG TPA: hypothetical protein VGM39_00925 [Kofleriaceae bacterium]